ncbi:hypothetical protein [Pseudoalteromonas sp. SK20]|uniref:hypothetical protein n=1 Tax=Pseudoalteromonas sp. SK20 TaxID=1938367 RepID=UPI0009780F74|nr:hypothetical protein [Pseudoalteromonas sp. SK20]
MKKSTLLLAAVLALYQSNPLSKELNINISTVGLSEFEAREKAKLEARWVTAKDSPVLVSGNETIQSTGRYTREVTALSAAALNVKVLQEFWDKERNILSIKFDVTHNLDLSEAVFGSLHKNSVLQKQLLKAYESIDKLIRVNSSYDFIDAYSEMNMAQTAYNVTYMRSSFEDSLRVKSLLERDYETYVLNMYITPFINSLKPVLIDVNSKGLVVKFASEFYAEQSKVCKQLINSFFYQNQRRFRANDEQRCVNEPIFNELDLTFQKKWSSYVSNYKNGGITFQFYRRNYSDNELTAIMNEPSGELKKRVGLKYDVNGKARW